jgi:hypothetical protein
LTDYLFKRFVRLRRAEVDRLADFVAHRDVLVRGLDKRDWGAFRGGCMPYVGLVAAGTLWFAWEAIGLIRPVGIGLALSAAVLGTSAMVRTVIAGVRSRKLMKRDEGWVGLAWSKKEFCFRSLDLCVIAPWSSVTKVEYIEPEEGRILGDTLWVHLENGDKVLIEPFDGTFGGRPIPDWATDIDAIWKKRR